MIEALIAAVAVLLAWCLGLTWLLIDTRSRGPQTLQVQVEMKPSTETVFVQQEHEDAAGKRLRPGHAALRQRMMARRAAAS